MKNDIKELDSQIIELEKQFEQNKAERKKLLPICKNLDDVLSKISKELKEKKIQRGIERQSKCPAFSSSRDSPFSNTIWKCLIKNAEIEFYEVDSKRRDWFKERICGSCTISPEDASLRIFTDTVSKR